MAKHDLAPGLLLAAPRLGDPNFERTVVLLGRHEAEGALGWVLNGKSLGPVRELLHNAKLVPASGVLPATPAFDADARVGGPVATTTGWIVYRRAAGLEVPGQIDVGPDLGVSGNPTAFEAVLRGEAPTAFRMLIGYAGWGPGQLEAEVHAGAWLPAPVAADLVFDVAAAELWDAAYHRAIGAAPAAFTSTRRGMA